MLVVLVDAVVLMGLLQWLSDAEMSMLFAVVLSFIASIAATVLALVLAGAMGLVGLMLAATLVAAALGTVVSYVYGVEIKRAFAIGGIFLVVHVGMSVLLNMVLTAGTA